MTDSNLYILLSNKDRSVITPEGIVCFETPELAEQYYNFLAISKEEPFEDFVTVVKASELVQGMTDKNIRPKTLLKSKEKAGVKVTTDPKVIDNYSGIDHEERMIENMRLEGFIR